MATVFVLLDGGTAEATVTCTVSPVAWTRADPEVVVGVSGYPVNELACVEWWMVHVGHPREVSTSVESRALRDGSD